MEIPEGYKQISIDSRITSDELKGCFLFNHNWKTGGFFGYGTDHGFACGNSWYNTITGDNLYDHITINGFKVYKHPNPPKEEEDDLFCG